MSLARVTIWEGGTADGIRGAAETMRSNMAQGPPPGLKSSGFTMLTAADRGRVVMIGIFENADDLRESEAVLQAMDPPPGMGQHTGTHVYEVSAEIRM